MQVNYHATVRLAQTAKDLGVKKFIFTSSIQVNGESTQTEPFSEISKPIPANSYALSKLEAEKALQNICSNMDLIIIRPPLLYGPHCKGNFQSLIKLCKLPVPLPFGLSTNNKRSLLYVGNFSDFVIRCIESSGKTGIYLIADDIPLSTASMIKLIRESLGSRSLLMPIPYLDNFLQLIGKKDVATKLLGSLEVDITKAKKDFNWTPPYTPKEGIYRTIKAL
jgi:UDP-glucose 4-epimerase